MRLKPRLCYEGEGQESMQSGATLQKKALQDSCTQEAQPGRSYQAWGTVIFEINQRKGAAR